MLAWFSDLNQRERRTMIACFGGWSLDAMDVMIFSFVIPSLLTLWHITKAEAGILATVTLVVSALGGWFAGALADRYGRVRVLQVAILWYAFFTFLCGFANDFYTLFTFRALQGLGFGGEWAAGAVLMGEVIREVPRPRRRDRADRLVHRLGCGSAALHLVLRHHAGSDRLESHVLDRPRAGHSGVLDPPLCRGAGSQRAPCRAGRLHAFVRCDEAAAFVDHSAPLDHADRRPGRRMGGGTFLPTYLKTVRDMTSVGTGGYLLVLILGAFCGFVSGAYFADMIGRKKTFMISAVGSIVLVLVYLYAPLSNEWILRSGSCSAIST